MEIDKNKINNEIENCFNTFELPVAFDLDKRDLIERRNLLIGVVHPDVNPFSSKEIKAAISAAIALESQRVSLSSGYNLEAQSKAFHSSAESMTRAAVINAHFQILHDDVFRARHIFELCGYQVEGRSQAFSPVIFSLYERLGNIAAEVECRAFQDEVITKMAAMSADMATAFAEDDLDRAMAVWENLFFLRGFLNRIKDKIRQIVLVSESM